MVSQEQLRFRRGDLLAVALVVLLAVLSGILFFPGGGAKPDTAEVYQDGRLVKVVALAEDQLFTVSGTYSNVVSVQNGKISIIESDCPGSDCVHSGWIGASGRSIVCLPNGVELRVAASISEIDFVVG